MFEWQVHFWLPSDVQAEFNKLTLQGWSPAFAPSLIPGEVEVIGTGDTPAPCILVMFTMCRPLSIKPNGDKSKAMGMRG